eukprot:g30534.t1
MPSALSPSGLSYGFPSEDVAQLQSHRRPWREPCSASCQCPTGVPPGHRWPPHLTTWKRSPPSPSGEVTPQDPLACGTRLSELMEQENSEQTDGGSPKSNLGTPGIKSVTFDNSAAVSDYHRPKISKTLTEAHRNVLDCDLDLLRGIPLRRTLRQGGHVWRSKPREMKASERMKFYSQSKPTTSIDAGR